MNNSLDIIKIQEILPHRYPFLFIDKVISIDIKDKKAVCQKNFTINEYFFTGHFSHNPVVPGVIIIESMAQASIILYSALKPNIAKTHPNYYLGKVEVNFRSPVLPGNILIIEVVALKVLANSGIMETIAKVNNEVVANSVIIFSVRK